jgi:hypothetical protein
MRSFAARRIAVFPIAVAFAAFFWVVINVSGPATASWLVGLTLIGLVWLASRRGLPANRATALMLAGFALLCVVAVGGGELLFGARYGLGWKGMIFLGVVTYLVGFALALREKASSQVRLGRFVAIAVVVVIPLGFGFLISPWPNQMGVCDGEVPEWMIPDDYNGEGCVEMQQNLVGLAPWNWGKWRQVCLGMCLDGSLVWDSRTRTWHESP